MRRILIQHGIHNLGGRIDKVKQDLGAQHRAGKEAMTEMGAQLGEQIEIVTKRLMASETGTTTTTRPPEPREDPGRWRPQHIIMGGWGSKRSWWDKLEAKVRAAKLEIAAILPEALR